MSVCPEGAIHLVDGLALLDKAVCTQCRACVEACPQGAMALFEAPVEAAKPILVRPEREAKVVIAEPVGSSSKPWLAAALAFAGKEILRRMGEALITVLDRRLEQARATSPQVSP